MPIKHQLGIFAKYWQPGSVKTRLAKDVGQEAAAALHRLFLCTLLKRFAITDAIRVLVFSPADRRMDFARLSNNHWQLEPQVEGDLGQRMAEYFRSAFEQGCERVVLIGADSPTLPVEYVSQAFRELETHSVVLGPSIDGGYYLVGAARSVPPIFDGVDWSTNHVWEQTLRLLEAARIPVARLSPWYDVDDVEDLRRLAQELDPPTEEFRELATEVTMVLENKR